MDNFTKILDWDTTFFGRKIAKIVINNPDEEYVKEKLLEYKSLAYDLVYIFLAGNAILPETVCSEYNCKLVDSKLIYSLSLQGEYVAPTLVHEFKGKSSCLYELAFQAGSNSRYRTDINFAEDDFRILYKAWVDNSVKHLIADKIFIFNDEQSIDGFITVKLQKDEASIGLIATDLKQRGRGIGSQLLLAVKKYAKDMKAINLSVATQKENILACSFYEKNGFSLKSETNIYHAWLKK